MNNEEKLKEFYEKGMKNCEFFIGATNKGNAIYGKTSSCLAGLTVLMRELRETGVDEEDLLKAVKLSGKKEDELLDEALELTKKMLKKLFGDDE